jgi:CheY-like chemotaxis protein
MSYSVVAQMVGSWGINHMESSNGGAASGGAAQSPTVLLVEDDFLIRMDMAETLRTGGWRVIEAGTAQSGIDIVRSGMPFDVLLTDVQMPGQLTGLDLASVVRKERPGARVAAMSGTYLPTVDGWHSVCDLFMAKPISALLDELNKLLGSGETLGLRDAQAARA